LATPLALLEANMVGRWVPDFRSADGLGLFFAVARAKPISCADHKLLPLAFRPSAKCSSKESEINFQLMSSRNCSSTPSWPSGTNTGKGTAIIKVRGYL
jgi:hypothetical protein